MTVGVSAIGPVLHVPLVLGLFWKIAKSTSRL
jgi:hypothetical protein